MEVVTWIMRVSLTVSASLLSGCVYNQIKADTDDFVKNGAPVVQAAKDADKKLQDATYFEVNDRLRKRDDGTCPLARAAGGPLNPKPLYVRNPEGGKNPALQILGDKEDDTSAATDRGCAQLYHCESDPDAADCQSVCYSEPEMACIGKIKNYVMGVAANAKRGKDGKPIDQPNADMDIATLESRLQEIERAPRTSPANLRLMFIATALDTYLTELTKVADKKTDEIKPIHDHFLVYESQFMDAYKSIDSKPPKSVTADQAKLVDTSNAIDDLVNSVATVVDEQQRSSAIEVTVKENDANFDLALADAHQQLVAMASDLRQYNKSRWEAQRKDFFTQFQAVALPVAPKATASPEARQKYKADKVAVTSQRRTIRDAYDVAFQAYQSNDTALTGLVASYKDMFAKLDSSRKQLRDFITNPTSHETLASVKDGLANAANIATKIVVLYALIS